MQGLSRATDVLCRPDRGLIMHRGYMRAPHGPPNQECAGAADSRTRHLDDRGAAGMRSHAAGWGSGRLVRVREGRRGADADTQTPNCDHSQGRGQLARCDAS